MVKTTYEALAALETTVNKISSKMFHVPGMRKALSKIHTRDSQIISFICHFRECFVDSHRDPQKLLAIYDKQPKVVHFMFESGFAEYINRATDYGIILTACFQKAVNVLTYILRNPDWVKFAHVGRGGMKADRLSTAFYLQGISDDMLKVFLLEAPMDVFQYAKDSSAHVEDKERDAALYANVVRRLLNEDNLSLFRTLVRRGMGMESAKSHLHEAIRHQQDEYAMNLVWLKAPLTDGVAYYDEIRNCRKAYDALIGANRTRMFGMDMLSLELSLLQMFRNGRGGSLDHIQTATRHMNQIALICTDHPSMRKYMTVQWTHDEPSRGVLACMGIPYYFDHEGKDIVAYTMQTNDVYGMLEVLAHPKYGVGLDRYISAKSLIPRAETKISTVRLFVSMTFLFICTGLVEHCSSSV